MRSGGIRDKGVSLPVVKVNANILHVAVENNCYIFLEDNIDEFSLDEIESRNRWDDKPLMIAQKQGKHKFIELLTSHRDSLITRNS